MSFDQRDSVFESFQPRHRGLGRRVVDDPFGHLALDVGLGDDRQMSSLRVDLFDEITGNDCEGADGVRDGWALMVFGVGEDYDGASTLNIVNECPFLEEVSVGDSHGRFEKGVHDVGVR